MRLATLTRWLVFGILVLCIVFQILLQRYVVYPEFASLEAQKARDDIQRCIDAIGRELYHVGLLTTDWAKWDDSYAFVDDRNADYIASNLNDASFANNRLDLMVYLNNDRQVVFGKRLASDMGGEALATAGHCQVLPRVLGSLIWGEDELDGVLDTPSGVLLFASRPIMTSMGEGPSRGRLVMGRFLDDEMLELLREQTKVNFDLDVVTDADVDAIDVDQRRGAFLWATGHIASVIDGQIIQVRAELSRQIMAAGKKVIAFSLLATVGVLLLLLLGLQGFVHWSMVRQIESFSTHIHGIRQKQDLTARIVSGRIFEFQQLALEYNAMLSRLAREDQRRKRAERRLIESIRAARVLREKAQAADQSKSEFLANMSHEMRTPMNSILGFCEVLSDEPLTDDQREYLGYIHKSGRVLLDLINDILDLSKIEAGRFTIALVEAELGGVLAETADMMRPLAERKGIAFELTVDEGVPETIYTDPVRFRQCMVNLIGNAIKFTESGGVYVRVSYARDTETGTLCVAVRDTGIGIRRDRLDAIFDAFMQSDSSASRRFGGTGLGLTITRHLAEMMGGAVGVESDEGKGSTFTLRVACEANGYPVPQPC